MKKFYSFVLALLTLFSCVLFSACADKYRNLKMELYNSNGEAVEEVRMVIDESDEAQTMSVEFKNIDAEDVGQILVYSIPNELISVSNYSYQNKTCYFDVNANMASKLGARLVVTHLSSNKKISFPLTIDQKSNNLSVVNSQYIVSIPEKMETSQEQTSAYVHYLDFSKTVDLSPNGSTDSVYFKLAEPSQITGVEFISATENIGVDNVYSGFRVSDSVVENVTALKVYPVTYLKGYQATEYKNEIISIWFKHTLNNENVGLTSETNIDLNNIQLIANDNDLNSYKLSLKYFGLNLTDELDDELLTKTKFFQMYRIDLESSNDSLVSAFADANNDILLTAQTFTEQPILVKIILEPINYVGDIKPVELEVSVKGELKSDKILTQKDGDTISTNNINIFDYYETGTSLGAMFMFNPGENVHQDLNKMRFLVNPEILCDANNMSTGVEVDSKKYSLMFSLVEGVLKFEYDETSGMMISQLIDSNTKVYIKYLSKSGDWPNPTDFSAIVQTVNQSTLPHWQSLENISITLNFSRLEGVKTMELKAGYFNEVEAGYKLYENSTKLTHIYLNRLEGLDNGSEEIDTYFLYVNDNVQGVEDGDSNIVYANFNVVVEQLGSGYNPLTIYNGALKKDTDSIKYSGNSKIEYEYYSSYTHDVIGLVFRKNTDLGDYRISFYQEKILKGSVICTVYESLTELNKDSISFETNKKVFANENYQDKYNSDYIVASGQSFIIDVVVPQSVLDSNIIVKYHYNFKIGVKDEDGNLVEIGGDEALLKDYFAITTEGLSYAKLHFKSGTFIEMNQYVFVTVSVETVAYENIVKINSENSKVSTELSFFIYNEITQADLTINHNALIKYPADYLGVDYKEELSKAKLKVSMEESLWNYITSENLVTWNVNGENVKYNSDSNNDGAYDEFRSNGVTVTGDINLKDCEFSFGKIFGANDGYIRTIKAYITQFGNVFELVCVVYVENPILTERIIINSEVLSTNDEQENAYINLKLGEDYQVLADNISSEGEVTHPEIAIQIADEFGDNYNVKDYFEINYETSEIKVIKVDNLSKFKLIIFAKDVLKVHLSARNTGYTNPSSFLMDDYNQAYFVMDIYLSDGTEGNPYLIHNAYDFWAIDDVVEYKSAHYQLMDNISLDNVNDSSIMKAIQGFTGEIKTYRDLTYEVDGIKLNNNLRNIFVDFAGKISNINFVVNYAYDIDSAKTISLGVFNNNYGEMLNIGVDVRGYANLNNGTYYFGGLVGENLNEIKFDESEGILGTIDISGDAEVYFGGLVGKNNAKIIGTEPESSGIENKIQLNMSNGRQNVLSQITINSTLGGASVLGGVIGLNYGSIKNAFVQATINAPETNNVGGVIGKNEQTTNSVLIALDNGYVLVEKEVVESLDKDNAIYNVKSASIINAQNNVGGIVGVDINGLYIDCDYQILSQDYKTPALSALDNVGGIAGNSTYGKFIFCSVMSYNWNYSALNEENAEVVTDVCDITGNNKVGGIVGGATSSINTDLSPLVAGEISNKTIVAYSSVNAYIVAESSIGGILSSNEGNSIIYSAYFIGKLEGEVKHTNSLVLDNDSSSYYNAVYCLNLETVGTETSLKIGKSLNGVSDFNIDKVTDRDFWWWNANINGGYIFVTNDDSDSTNKLPIFDLAPETISVEVNDKKADGLERVLMLNYYDFSIAENTTDEILMKLIELNNRNQYVFKQDGSGLLNIIAYPENIGTVVINVKSTNTNIVDIAYDGRLLINGVGECELVFSSVLNPNAGEINNRTIKVIVDYPIGTDFNISTSKTNKSAFVNNTTQNIGLNSSKQFYIVTEGICTYKNNNYSYKTKANINLKVEITQENADINISEYLISTGKVLTSTNPFIIDIDKKTPFMLSVKKMFEEGKFNVSVTPYEIINGIEILETEQTISFELSTLEGVTNVSFSYDEAIIYPNDTVYLNAYLSTDKKLENVDEVMSFIKLLDSKYSYERDESSSNYAYFIKKGDDAIGGFIIYVDDFSYYKDNLQKIKFRIEFNDINIDEEVNLEFRFNLAHNVYESVYYNLLPQRINKIEIKNYYYKNISEGTQELVQQDILKPNSAGKMIIDIVPDNGYYDYLEISDITGNEEILFIQVDEQGNALSLNYDPSSDGKGIKLYDYNLEKSRIYIRTQISNKYSSKTHIIEVRAYSSNGILLASNRKYIEVKMLPEISATYILPDGSADRIAGNGEGQISSQSGLYLAKGVSARLLVESKNANTEIEYRVESTNNNYEIVKDVNNFYTLQPKGSFAQAGEKVKVTFKTYALLDNGDFDIAECSMEFNIAEFVIHSFSVNSSIDNSSTKEIYGYFNKELKLEFYFDKNDISYYDSNSVGDYFWDTEYVYDENWASSYAKDSPLYQIHSILFALNSTSENNPYLILNNTIKKNGEYEVVTSENIELSNNTLVVNKDYSPDHLAVAFMLNYNGTTWSIANYNGTKSNDGYYIVDKNYKLNFKQATQWFEPTVINSVEDFKAMASGGRYILNADLTLEDYTPIDAHLIEFDGNGHTIKIQNFASFNDVNIKAGLFAQIYAGETVDNETYPTMVVKNVKVVYQSEDNYSLGKVLTNSDIEYFDICNNSTVDYLDAKFGGIAAINNGIITNCVVEGCIAVKASILEQKTVSTGGNYQINFNIAGMVAENSATGYITNSSSELQIFAQANVGGFVHTNSGKITSCSVEEDATIYGYNKTLGNTIIVDIAGFAVENSGEISMSYVNLKKGVNIAKVDSLSIYQGTMSAKDFSAGFVSENTGDISDSYVQMTAMGINNNRFAGFVMENSGTIERAYTFINAGVKANKDDDMFIGENLGTILNCIEFVVDNQNKTVEGLSSISANNKTDKSIYTNLGFGFGDNISAVWSIQSGNLPKLVSTSEFTFDMFEKLKITPQTILENGVEKELYKVNYATYGTKENPYIVQDLESWNNFFNPQYNANMTGYYRLVKDIDFSSLGDNPITSSVDFAGNIQGNNMNLQAVMLYATENLEALGLFKTLSGTNDKTVINAVRNLSVNASSVWASSTNAVGVLAGIINNFNVYNIEINSPNVIMVGGNAVGGLAGVVRGEFDIDQISSNIGASSTRVSTSNTYAVYMSKNNNVSISSNLNKVYYAGAVVGILDGYYRTNFNINEDREINNKYNKVQNISVNGEIAHSGDTVGGAFGFVGEKVYVNNVVVNISGLLNGSQYSAGIVGENRGVLNNATVVLADEMFVKSKYVSAGAVGFNLGGLVYNVEVVANIVNSNYAQTVGGIVGRNINGTINNVNFDGEVLAYFTGGIIGANYSDEILINATAGSGAINGECTINSNLIPNEQVNYSQNSEEIANYQNMSISINAFEKMLENSTKCYTYKNDETTNNETLSIITVRSKVLGVVVGVNDKTVIMQKSENVYSIYFDTENQVVKFNSGENKNITFENDVENVTLKASTQSENDVIFNFSEVNVLNISVEKAYVMYLIGTNVSSFDSWFEYSDEYVLVK